MGLLAEQNPDLPLVVEKDCWWVEEGLTEDGGRSKARQVAIEIQPLTRGVIKIRYYSPISSAWKQTSLKPVCILNLTRRLTFH
jgi:hypothetical protein